MVKGVLREFPMGGSGSTRPPRRFRRIALAAARSLPPVRGRLSLQTGMWQIALAGPHRPSCGFAPTRHYYHIPHPAVSIPSPSVRRRCALSM